MGVVSLPTERDKSGRSLSLLSPILEWPHITHRLVLKGDRSTEHGERGWICNLWVVSFCLPLTSPCQAIALCVFSKSLLKFCPFLSDAVDGHGGDGKCPTSVEPLHSLQHSWLCFPLRLSFPSIFAENTIPGAIIARQQVHKKVLFFGHSFLNSSPSTTLSSGFNWPDRQF